MGTLPLRVLVIEDSEDDTLVLLSTLKRNGYKPTYQRVDSAAGMSAALEQPWDLVIADYVVPGFNAAAALSLLKEKGQDIPFIILSGVIDEASAVSALKAGAHDFVLKSRMARLIPAIEREMREAEIRRKHRQAEKALQQSEARYRSLAIATSAAVWTTNAQGEVVDDIPSWRALTGQSETAVKSWGWLAAIHPEDREQTAQMWKEAVATKSIYDIEHRVLLANGTYRYFSARGVPVVDGGEIQEWVGTHTDISDRVSMQSALRQRAEELTEANRIKDEFLAIVSHELRSPLNAMLGWVTLLRTRQFDAATTAKALETIERNARSQAQLIEDLLDISRIIRGQLRLNVCPVDLVSIIEAAIETVRLAADAKNIHLKTVLDPTASLVMGDSQRLQQVVWNLLTNAVKFTPNDGQVEIRLQGINSHAEIAVIDTGMGISAEFLPFVFDRFRQEDSSKTRSYSGLGLGLSIVRHLVELHGGTVHVYSQGVDCGSYFIINLPLLQETRDEFGAEGAEGEWVRRESGRVFNPKSKTQNPTSPQPQASSPSPRPSLLNDLRILVVDDQADARELLISILQQEGFEVMAVATADEAMSALIQTATRFDLLISDIGMPGEDGYSLIRKVRAMKPLCGGQIPAIALSAYARSEDATAALLAGFHYHIAKPVDHVQLFAAIASAAGRT